MPQTLVAVLGTDVKPEWHTYTATEPTVVEENWTSACSTCGGGPQPGSGTDTGRQTVTVRGLNPLTPDV